MRLASSAWNLMPFDYLHHLSEEREIILETTIFAF